jgi:23S rRNA (uracil1939-C5)-methyltransferase
MARKKNKVRILENILVEDYAAEGRSLARIDGKVVFIERTVPGDIVDVCLTKSKKDWGEGFPVKFHEYSSRRVQPFCIHFGDCGGCQWQMVPYEEQLRFKQQQVIDALQRIAKVELPEIKTILGAARDRFFRNKLEFTFGNKKYVSDVSFKKIKQEAQAASGDAGPVKVKIPDANAVGFHARGLFDKVVDIKECWLQSPPSNEVREAVRQFADLNGYTYYDPRNHVGFLRNLQLRVCESGEVMVNLIVGEKDQEKIDALMDHLEKNISGVSTWLYTVNTKWNDSLFDLQPITWSGKGFAIEHLYTGNGNEHYQFKIGPTSFFQTNTKQAEKLYQVTRDYAELTGKEIVYDLYCGTGSIGIFVSGQAKKIIGVELIAAAIEDAKENAALNNLDKTAFFAGDVIDICNDDFFASHGRPDVIITDPPRAGMHEKLVRKILDMAAPTVVYVSCNPATQARDLHLLDEKYMVTAVQPVDMFPHTHHIETVVQLKLKNK